MLILLQVLNTLTTADAEEYTCEYEQSECDMDDECLMAIGDEFACFANQRCTDLVSCELFDPGAPECSAGCTVDILGDANCDAVCNTPECYSDFLDCDGSSGGSSGEIVFMDTYTCETVGDYFAEMGESMEQVCSEGSYTVRTHCICLCILDV